MAESLPSAEEKPSVLKMFGPFLFSLLCEAKDMVLCAGGQEVWHVEGKELGPCGFTGVQHKLPQSRARPQLRAASFPPSSKDA